MRRSTGDLVVLIIIFAVFFIFIAILFGSNKKHEAVVNRAEVLDARLDMVADTDLVIYWIGEPYKELEHLMPAVNVIQAGDASAENLPIRGALFHTRKYDNEGNLSEENIPIEYPKHILIIISGNPEFTDAGKAALLDAASQNGVPVLAIGDAASEALAEVLSYHRFHKGPGSSLYYCLGKGYMENVIPVEAAKAGGMDLAEAIPDAVLKAEADYVPQK